MVRPGTEKTAKWYSNFRILDQCDIVILLTARILMFWCPGKLSKLEFRLQKLILVQNFVKNAILTILAFSKICTKFFMRFCFFHIFRISLKNENFDEFPLFWFHFDHKILPERPL